MGYVHSARMTQDIPLPAWRAVIRDFNTLLDHLPAHARSSGAHYADDPLALSMERRPTPRNRAIRFNGGAPLSGEDCFLPRTLQAARAAEPWHPADGAALLSCKTNRLPYDQVVQACLLLVQQHAPDSVMIASDGTWADWQPAMAWVTETLPDLQINKPLFAALLARDEMAEVLATLPDPKPSSLAVLERLMPDMGLSEEQQSAIDGWRLRILGAERHQRPRL